MDFNREFFEKTKAHTRDKNYLILSEINMNLMNQSSVVSCEDFLIVSFSENYTSLIDIPTGVNRTSATCLNHTYGASAK